MTIQSGNQRLKGDDVFIQAADGAGQWFGKHRVVGLAALGAGALVLAGALMVGQLHQRRDLAAAGHFAQGYRALDGRLTDAASEAKRAEARAAAKKARAERAKADADADADTNDDDFEDNPDALRFPSEKARWQAAKDAFAQAEASRGHAGIGALAGLLVADLEAKLGDQQASEKHFDALRHDLKGDERLLFLAAERYAYAREAQNDLDGALQALTELTDGRKNFYADRATLHQARLYEAKKDSPKAIALLESMQQNFPRTQLAEEIALRLEALSDAQAQAPTPSPAQGQAQPPHGQP